MHLDLRTLLWVLFFGNLGLAASVLIVQWRTRSQDGLAAWGWGLLVQAAAYPAFALRLLDWHLASLVLTNLFSAGTLSLHLQAVATFQRGTRRAPPTWMLWGPLPLVGGLALLLDGDDVGRNLFGAIVMAAQSLALAWYTWSPGLRTRRERGRWLVVFGAAMLCAGRGEYNPVDHESSSLRGRRRLQGWHRPVRCRCQPSGRARQRQAQQGQVVPCAAQVRHPVGVRAAA